MIVESPCEKCFSYNTFQINYSKDGFCELEILVEIMIGNIIRLWWGIRTFKIIQTVRRNHSLKKILKKIYLYILQKKTEII